MKETPNMKIICIDYDGSYTDFPELFDVIISTAKQQGHKVILATMRHQYEMDAGLKNIVKKHHIDVYFTGRKAKMVFMENKGISPDLWIDDKPQFLLHDAI